MHMAAEILIVTRILHRAGGQCGPSDLEGKDMISRSTSTWVEDSHYPQINGHSGLLQEPDVWLQGGF